jgi:hypothetical protein
MSRGNDGQLANSPIAVIWESVQRRCYFGGVVTVAMQELNRMRYTTFDRRKEMQSLYVKHNYVNAFCVENSNQIDETNDGASLNFHL